MEKKTKQILWIQNANNDYEVNVLKMVLILNFKKPHKS